MLVVVVIGVSDKSEMGSLVPCEAPLVKKNINKALAEDTGLIHSPTPLSSVPGTFSDDATHK